MNHPKRQFESLAAAARRETEPIGDVTIRTLATIRERERDRAAGRPMLVFAGVYGAVCLLALAVGYAYLGVETDPMGSFFALASGIAP